MGADHAVEGVFPGLTDYEFQTAQCIAIGKITDATNAAESDIARMLADPVARPRIATALRNATDQDLLRLAREATVVPPEVEDRLVAHLEEVRDRLISPEVMPAA